MSRVAWLTDIHLNFVNGTRFDQLVDELMGHGPDIVLVGGDIAEAHDVGDWLGRLDDCLAMPLYFVLGNHDYYFGSIAQVRAQMDDLCRGRPRLCYLTQSLGAALAPGVGLVGHDGWSDARAGDFDRSPVQLNDYRLIQELTGCSKSERRARLQALGDEAARHIRAVLPEALEAYAHVFLLTHVPPLREACWYEGRTSNDDWAPHFTCQAVGETILDIMTGYPYRQLTVLCGHTHGHGEIRPMPHVRILTGGAVYGEPAMSRMFEF